MLQPACQQLSVSIARVQVGVADIARSDAQFTYNDGADVSAGRSHAHTLTQMLAYS